MNNRKYSDEQILAARELINSGNQLQQNIAQNSQQSEGFGESITRAPLRMGEDVIKGLYGFMKNIPKYAGKAKTEIPGLANVIQNDPTHALKQAGAGFSEMGQKVFNTPHDIINYFSNRLNLFPKDINRMVQMGRMPEDTGQMINQTFGKPEYAGEELLRGALRNIPEISGIGGAAKALNPMKLTSGGIMKDILQGEKKAKEIYSGPKGLYSDLFNDARKRGLGDVDINLKDIDYQILKKSGSEKSISGLTKFMEDRSIESGQKAIKDLGIIERKLEKQESIRSLNESELDQLKATKNVKKLIQENMFKDKSGNIHNDLLKRHRSIQEGYREDVIPYTKSSPLQKYKRNELNAEEAVQRLKKGEFAAKKGSEHWFQSKEMMKNLLKYLAKGAAYGTGGLGVYKLMKGRSEE